MRNKRTDRILLTSLLLLVAFYIIFLNSRSADVSVDHVADPYQDTISPKVTSASTSGAFPVIFDAAFLNGTTVQQGKELLTFRTIDLGTMKVESGRLIACDNVNISQMPCFTEKFPVGDFPVQVALTRFGTCERVAFSRILFSKDSIAHWEFALLPGQEAIGIHDSLTYGYTVDAAIALFIDSVSNCALTQTGDDGWNEAFMTPWTNNCYTGYIHKFGEHSLAVFSSGEGDGRYSAYIGYNISNQPCCLLTDFGYVNWWNIHIET